VVSIFLCLPKGSLRVRYSKLLIFFRFFSNISPRNQLRVNWWFLPKPPGSPNHQITISWKKEKSVWDFDPKFRSNFYLAVYQASPAWVFFLKNEATSTTLWYWDVNGCTQRQTPWHSSEHSSAKSKKTLWYWGSDLEPWIMYFQAKWGAKEPQNPQNHRIVNKSNNEIGNLMGFSWKRLRYQCASAQRNTRKAWRGRRKFLKNATTTSSCPFNVFSWIKLCTWSSVYHVCDLNVFFLSENIRGGLASSSDPADLVYMDYHSGARQERLRKIC